MPGGAFGAQPYSPAIKHPDATFVQEVSYRSLDPKHATNVVQELKTLRRTVRTPSSDVKGCMRSMAACGLLSCELLSCRGTCSEFSLTCKGVSTGP